MGVIKSQAYARAPTVAPGAPLQDLDDTGTSNADASRALGQAVTCPILMADGSDIALLLSQAPAGLPLLSAFDASTVSFATENPLNMMRNSEFKRALLDSLDTTLSLAALQSASACGRPMTESPMTRKPLCGVVVMGADSKHAQTTNAALAALITGGKKMGNADLWYALLYFAVAESPTMMERFPELLPGLETQLKWRLLNRKSFASLCGDTTRLNVSVPLAVALWHVTHACLTQDERFTLSSEEPLRAHLLHLSFYSAMLRMVDVDYNVEAFVHAQHLRALQALLGVCKKDPWFFLKVKALYQQSIAMPLSNIPLVLLDGPARPEDVAAVLELLPYDARSLTVEEIDGLAAKCSQQFSFGDLVLPFKWTPPATAATVVDNWPFFHGACALALQKHCSCCLVVIFPCIKSFSSFASLS